MENMDDFIKELDEQLNMAMKSQNGDLSRINIDESPEERKVRNLLDTIHSFCYYNGENPFSYLGSSKESKKLIRINVRFDSNFEISRDRRYKLTIGFTTDVPYVDREVLAKEVEDFQSNCIDDLPFARDFFVSFDFNRRLYEVKTEYNFTFHTLWDSKLRANKISKEDYERVMKQMEQFPLPHEYFSDFAYLTKFLRDLVVSQIKEDLGTNN